MSKKKQKQNLRHVQVTLSTWGFANIIFELKKKKWKERFRACLKICFIFYLQDFFIHIAGRTTLSNIYPRKRLNQYKHFPRCISFGRDELFSVTKSINVHFCHSWHLLPYAMNHPCVMLLIQISFETFQVIFGEPLDAVRGHWYRRCLLDHERSSIYLVLDLWWILFHL